MTLMLCGLALFFGFHLIPALPPVRQPVVAGLGEQRWKGLFSLMALLGLVLIVLGWRQAPNDFLFAPSPLARQLATPVVTLAVVLVVAANLPCHLRRWVRHPMLIGVALWSIVHLLANGGLRETWLFGSFLAFSLFDLASVLLRGKRASFVPQAKFDALAVVIGVVVAVAAALAHPWAFGVSAR